MYVCVCVYTYKVCDDLTDRAVHTKPPDLKRYRDIQIGLLSGRSWRENRFMIALHN